MSTSYYDVTGILWSTNSIKYDQSSDPSAVIVAIIYLWY